MHTIETKDVIYHFDDDGLLHSEDGSCITSKVNGFRDYRLHGVVQSDLITEEQLDIRSDIRSKFIKFTFTEMQILFNYDGGPMTVRLSNYEYDAIMLVNWSISEDQNREDRYGFTGIIVSKEQLAKYNSELDESIICEILYEYSDKYTYIKADIFKDIKDSIFKPKDYIFNEVKISATGISRSELRNLIQELKYA